MSNPEKKVDEDGEGDTKLDTYNNNADATTPLKIKKLLETEEEHRRRKFSRWIIYFSMFIQSIGFSIVLTGVWPYIEQLEENPDKRMLGWAVAANPIGQLIFSPLMGWLCNRVQSIRIPSVICLVLFIIANIWYALLPLHSKGGQWFLMVARFIVGASSGSIAVCRTYLTQATTVGERTAAISHLSLFQALGFILGPTLQSAFVPLGKEGIKIGGSYALSMYTASGWVSFILGGINLAMFHPKIFRESDIAQREADYLLKQKEEENKANNTTEKIVDWTKIPPDYFGICVVIIAFFNVLFNFILLETLGVPVAMDQFEWDEKQAIFWVGITISISSVITVACFATIGPICKKIDERIVLIGFGLAPMVLGRMFFFPFGGDPPALSRHGCIYEEEKIYDREKCDYYELPWEVVDPGCSSSQSWCSEIPALKGSLVIIGYTICTIGYPYAVALIQTIFSKMVGPRPQGIWMGFLTSVSSLSRACGPIFVGYIYTNFGTIATNGAATGFMAFSLTLLCIFYKKLVPIKVPEVNKS